MDFYCSWFCEKYVYEREAAKQLGLYFTRFTLFSPFLTLAQFHGLNTPFWCALYGFFRQETKDAIQQLYLNHRIIESLRLEKIS